MCKCSVKCDGVKYTVVIHYKPDTACVDVLGCWVDHSEAISAVESVRDAVFGGDSSIRSMFSRE